MKVWDRLVFRVFRSKRKQKERIQAFTTKSNANAGRAQGQMGAERKRLGKSCKVLATKTDKDAGIRYLSETLVPRRRKGKGR